MMLLAPLHATTLTLTLAHWQAMSNNEERVWRGRRMAIVGEVLDVGTSTEKRASVVSTKAVRFHCTCSWMV